MPFVQVSVKQQIEERRQNNLEFRKLWDESRAEYKEMGERIALEKCQKSSLEK